MVFILELLLDEMYAGLKEYVEVLGWKAFTVHDLGMRGNKDREIVEYAKEHDMVLVTQDQKPAELAELLGVKFVYIATSDIARAIDLELKERYPELGAHLEEG